MNTPFTHRSALVAVLLLVVLSMAGCGQKGDLYLPDPDGEKKQESSSQ